MRQSLFLFRLCVGLCLVVIGIALLPTPEEPLEHHFWNQAPDGIYAVWVSVIESAEDGYSVVWFPLCEHSAGQLHGKFRYLSTVEFKESHHYRVWLENNVIIHSIEIRGDK